MLGKGIPYESNAIAIGCYFRALMFSNMRIYGPAIETR
jgi:hypothetical protein